MNKFKQFLTLVRIEGTLATPENTTGSNAKKTKIKKILKTFGIVVFIVYFMVMGFIVSKKLIEGLAQLDQEGYFIKIIMSIIFILTIVTSIGTSTVQLAQEKTSNILNTYPISSRKRFLANFVSYIIRSYSVVLMLVVIPMIYYGVVKELKFNYYISLIFAVIFLPMLVSMIIYALMFVINGIIKLFVNKKVLKWLGFIFMLAFSVGYTLFYNSFIVSDNPVEKILIVVQKFETSPFLYYPNVMANFILGVDTFKNLAIILGLNMTTFIFLYITIGKVYLNEQLRLMSLGKGIGILNYIRVKKSKKDKQSEKKVKEVVLDSGKNFNKFNFKKKDPGFQYFKREISFFLKDPNVASNTILLPLLMPIFFFIGMYSSFSAISKEIKDNTHMYFVKNLDYMTEDKEEIEEIKNSEEAKDLIIKEEDGVLKIYSYELILENDLNNSFFKQGAPEVYVDEEGNIQQKEMDVDDEENKIIEELLIQTPTSEEILKAFSTDIFKNDDNIFYNYLEENNNFNLSEKNLEDLKQSFEYSKKEFNSKNTFEFIWHNRNFLKDKIDLGLDPFVYFMLPIFAFAAVTMFTSITIFMISKEKNEKVFLKTIPMSDLKQFNLKRLPGIITKFVFVIIYLIMIELIMNMYMYTKLHFWLGILFTIIMIILNDTIELYIDSNKPNFNWKTTVQLVKNTLISFILVFGKIIFVAVVVLIYIYLFHKRNIGLDKFVYVLVSFTIILSIIFEILIYKNRHKLLNKMV